MNRMDMPLIRELQITTLKLHVLATQLEQSPTCIPVDLVIHSHDMTVCCPQKRKIISRKRLFKVSRMFTFCNRTARLLHPPFSPFSFHWTVGSNYKPLTALHCSQNSIWPGSQKESPKREHVASHMSAACQLVHFGNHVNNS